jgi:type III secretion protein Q
MSPWRDLERISLAHARRQSVAALHFGTLTPVSVGRQAFTLQFDACRAGYPLRLQGQAAGEPFTLDCDAQALFPALSQQALMQAGADALVLVAQAFDAWLAALEGVFGFSLNVSGMSFDVAPRQGAYGLVLTHAKSRRAAHFALDSNAVDAWLKRQPDPADDMTRLSGLLRLPVPVCMAGPSLTVPRLRGIRRGDALLLERASLHLRLQLGHGARRISLKTSGEYILIDRPMIDDETESAELTSELVPTSALTFAFDAVIGTLSLTLDELTRLRTGSIVSLRLPVHRNSVLLLCQGVPFARGELIDIDDALGVRIVDLAHMGAIPNPS